MIDATELAQQIRRLSLMAIHAAGSGHPGGCLSAAELLAVLFGEELELADHHREPHLHHHFILSKGHACPALYAAAAETGLLDRSLLMTLRKLGSPLQGHPHVLATPFVETSTGSLGQGFSVALGVALGLRYKKSDRRTYVMLGDGELQEGEVWEGAMSAGHLGLSHLCGIIDYNKMQSDNTNQAIMSLEPLRAKWEAFNWQVFEIDGHNVAEIRDAFSQCKSSSSNHPQMIIAHTQKGKGVSFMEASPLWHGSVKLSDDELKRALDDLHTPQEMIDGYFVGVLG